MNFKSWHTDGSTIITYLDHPTHLASDSLDHKDGKTGSYYCICFCHTEGQSGPEIRRASEQNLVEQSVEQTILIKRGILFIHQIHPVPSSVSCVSWGHLHGSVEQHGGEDEDDVEDGQDAAHLTNLQLSIVAILILTVSLTCSSKTG